MISMYSGVLAATLLVSGDGAEQASSEPLPTSKFDVLADFTLSEAEQAEDHAFHAAAINPPWVYALDRQRRLYVLSLAEFKSPGLVVVDRRLWLERVLNDFGDGSGMKLIDGRYLAVANEGSLDIYSLSDPSKPRKVTTVEPKLEGVVDYVGAGLFVYDNRVVLFYHDYANDTGGALWYDLPAPDAPRFMAQKAMPTGVLSGCHIADKLYFCGVDSVMVMNPPSFGNLGDIERIKTSATVWQLFPIRENRLGAAMDTAGSETTIEIWNRDTAPQVIFRQTTPYAVKCTRAGVLVRRPSGTYLVSSGTVLKCEPDKVRIHSLFGVSHIMDGCFYSGDVSGDYVVVPNHDDVTVLRVTDTDSESVK